jgi:hypothetical protein
MNLKKKMACDLERVAVLLPRIEEQVELLKDTLNTIRWA